MAQKPGVEPENADLARQPVRQPGHQALRTQRPGEPARRAQYRRGLAKQSAAEFNGLVIASMQRDVAPLVQAVLVDSAEITITQAKAPASRTVELHPTC